MTGLLEQWDPNPRVLLWGDKHTIQVPSCTSDLTCFAPQPVKLDINMHQPPPHNSSTSQQTEIILDMNYALGIPRSKQKRKKKVTSAARPSKNLQPLQPASSSAKQRGVVIVHELQHQTTPPEQTEPFDRRGRKKNREETENQRRKKPPSNSRNRRQKRNNCVNKIIFCSLRHAAKPSCLP